jgi:hypothetical protein
VRYPKTSRAQCSFFDNGHFHLPFVGKNFFRGIVINDELAFGKDAAYELLKGCTSNWRRLLLVGVPGFMGFSTG